MELPVGLLLPLHSMTKSARFLDQAVTAFSLVFQSLKPFLELYLANNSLRYLPAELWNFDNLRVLSLRNNTLTRLPSSIGRLRSLVELNIAGNQLRWLPYELKALLASPGRLRVLNAVPNPFYKPFAMPESLRQLVVIPSKNGWGELYAELSSESPNQVQQELLARLSASYERRVHEKMDLSTVEPIYVARTPTTYYDADGCLTSESENFVLNADSDAVVPVALLKPGRFTSDRSTRVRSLFELAIQSAFTSPSLPTLHEYLPAETPDCVVSALETATMIQEEEGCRKCSVCRREYILPRTEWLEFWHRVVVHPSKPKTLQAQSIDELFLPFLRRGCSLQCVPPEETLDV